MKARVLALASAAVALTALAALPARAALEQGSAAPDFTAPAFLAGKAFTFKLDEALKQGPVVLYFFPAAYTPGCQIEAHLFAEAADEFKAQHATVIGVTAGNTDKLEKFSTDTQYCSGKFAMALDEGAKIAGNYKSNPGRTSPVRPHLLCDRQGPQDRPGLFQPEPQRPRHPDHGRGEEAQRQELIARDMLAFRPKGVRVPFRLGSSSYAQD
ncbi:MAG: redoxin domain-containing protein [Caulobacteraceae bacterium]